MKKKRTENGGTKKRVKKAKREKSKRINER